MFDLSQAPEPPGEVIIVTGRALPAAAADPLYGTVVIGEQELTNAPQTGLDQLLTSRIAGVQLFRRSDARSANPTSQGLTLRALGGNAASRTLLILDGVPQTDPFGGWIAWPAYHPDSLAEVRLTRGGGSVAAGPGALAGVVDLTSRMITGVRAEVEAGSRGSLDGSLLAGTGGLTLAVHGSRGDGFVPIVAGQRGPADRSAEYGNLGARLRWVTPAAPNVELQASLSAFIDRRERGLRFTGNRSEGLDGSLRLVGRGRLPWAATLYAQARQFQNSAGTTDADRTSARRTAFQYDVPGRALGGSVELRPLIGTTELRLGADSRFAHGRSDELGSYVAGEPTRERSSGGASWTAGLFAEATGTRGPLRWSAAARLDRWWIGDGRYEELSLTGGGTLQDLDFPGRSGWRPTARTAAALDLGSGLSVRAAAYLGWRLPTLNELFRPFRIGVDATAANPELEPERLRGIEAGLDWSAGPWTLSATAFANRLIDPIANVTLGTGPGSFPLVGFVPAGGDYRQRRNLDAIRARGLEMGAGWRSGPWRAGLSLSRVAATVSASGPAGPLEGLRPAQTPRWSAAANAGWTDQGRSVTASLRRIGQQYEDDRNEQALPSAWVADVGAAWPLTERLSLTARAENLFDEEVIAGISDNGVRERATPRTLWLGLRFGG